ncbi:hypothetical protein TSOC_010472 [Tetrabaena socialis]|uniref:Uncharacterized protein n=1 Tax=Tetrabaena socialis TaxID=47790 RepID=A0A2J7ZT92_9CHLO|nr:hypothetical protein TSOC_010472 [Tetrabaena socialis]|eukprot:PNH03460.1 hypothetical protein TSOC_010472 [Tetrabaena socialis]
MEAVAARGGHRRLWIELTTQAIALGALVWGLRVCLQYLDPYREQREQAKKRASFLKRHLGRVLELNEFEQLLAAQGPNNLVDALSGAPTAGGGGGGGAAGPMPPGDMAALVALLMQLRGGFSQ